jgi:hypothetical protein
MFKLERNPWYLTEIPSASRNRAFLSKEYSHKTVVLGKRPPIRMVHFISLIARGCVG